MTLIITGAGSGIGRAIAIESASRGADVFLVGRRKEPLEETAAACTGLGAHAVVHQGDVGRCETSADIVSHCTELFGGITGLINNAGIARFGNLASSTDEDFRLMFEINVLAPARLIRDALPALRCARGSVVNISSVGGLVSLPGRAAYGATKAALNHLTRSLARELAPDVRVNAVLPGPVDTPIYEDLGLDEAATQRLVETMIASTPAGRLGRPDELAPWVCELVAPSSAWVTGCLLTLDGGRSL